MQSTPRRREVAAPQGKPFDESRAETGGARSGEGTFGKARSFAKTFARHGKRFEERNQIERVEVRAFAADERGRQEARSFFFAPGRDEGGAHEGR